MHLSLSLSVCIQYTGTESKPTQIAVLLQFKQLLLHSTFSLILNIETELRLKQGRQRLAFHLF